MSLLTHRPEVTWRAHVISHVGGRERARFDNYAVNCWAAGRADRESLKLEHKIKIFSRRRMLRGLKIMGNLIKFVAEWSKSWSLWARQAKYNKICLNHEVKLLSHPTHRDISTRNHEPDIAPRIKLGSLFTSEPLLPSGSQYITWLKTRLVIGPWRGARSLLPLELDIIIGCSNYIIHWLTDASQILVLRNSTNR